MKIYGFFLRIKEEFSLFFYQFTFLLCLILSIPTSKKVSIFIRVLFESFIFIILFSIMGLKSVNVGSDTPTYVQTFYNSSTLNNNLANIFNQRFEFGYVALNKVLLNIFGNVQSLFIVVALVSLLSWFYIINKYSRSFLESIFIYLTFGLFTFSLSDLRQTIAISFVLLAFDAVIKNKVSLSIMFILIGSLFHLSALVFLTFVVMQNIKLGIKKFIVIILVSLSIFISFNFLLKPVLNIFTKFSSYTQTSYFSGDIKLSTVLSLIILFVFFVLGNLISYYTKSSTKLLEKLNILILIAICFNIIALRTSMLSRLTSYFSMFLVLYIPEFSSLIKNKWVRRMLAGLLLAFLFLYNYLIMEFRPEWNVIIPYEFYCA